MFLKVGPEVKSQRRPDVLNSPEDILGEQPEAAKNVVSLYSHTPEVPHIGIIGAGAAGMFTAMILKWLKEHASDEKGRTFDYRCDIIEASGNVGGRLNTHSFSNAQKDLYFDVGAMRYPENDIMKRYAMSPTDLDSKVTDQDRNFDLFQTLGMTKANSLKEAKLGQLVPYHMKNTKNTQEGTKEQLEYFCYNDVVHCGAIDKIMKINKDDPFNMDIARLRIGYVVDSVFKAMLT